MCIWYQMMSGREGTHPPSKDAPYYVLGTSSYTLKVHWRHTGGAHWRNTGKAPRTSISVRKAFTTRSKHQTLRVCAVSDTHQVRSKHDVNWWGFQCVLQGHSLHDATGFNENCVRDDRESVKVLRRTRRQLK